MKYIYLILLLLLIPSVNASSVVISQPNQPSAINLTANHTSLATQLIINIPYQAFEDVGVVDGIGFSCTESSADGVFAFRIYHYDVVGTYVLDDAFSVDHSACLDAGWLLHAYTNADIDTSDYFSLNRSMAIGIYSTNTIGSLWTDGSTALNDYAVPTISEHNNITDVDGNPLYFPDGVQAGNKIESVYHKIYGSGIIPTPTPTPSYTAPPITGETGSEDTGLGNGTQNSTRWTSFNESGNASFYDHIPAESSGINDMLRGFGLCDSGTCTAGDIKDFLGIIANSLWWTLFIIICIRFSNLKRGT